MKKTTLQLAEEARGFVRLIRKEVYNGAGNDRISHASQMAQMRLIQLIRALEKEAGHDQV